ncbi:MAG: electron transfer flavoprotein subunit alpha/FixB family protein [Alphaproteobacteria bacterium]
MSGQKTLLIVGHQHGVLAAGVAQLLTAAQELQGDVDVLLAGENIAAMADQLAETQGVARVLLAEAPHYQHVLAEEIAPLVVAHAGGYSHLLAVADSFGKNILPRVAALLDMPQISEVVQIMAPNRFVRPIYAGNALAEVEAASLPLAITIRPTAFAPANLEARGNKAEIIKLAALPPVGISCFVERFESKSDRPELASASIVVSGGRGLGSAENFKLVEALADKLGAAVGASRAAVDAGFAPNDWQVGQTGKVVAPKLYIAVGISGAIQHVAGMKDSKLVVAINKDAEAPIFQVADYGLVGDLFTLVPELVEKLG